MAKVLNRKQLLFVERFLESVRAGAPNGTQAYMFAFQCRSRDLRPLGSGTTAKGLSRVQELLHPVREAAEVVRVEQVQVASPTTGTESGWSKGGSGS